MVDVFKTNVEEITESELLLKVLTICFPGTEINFDLEDCDKVLRIQHQGIPAAEIIHLLSSYGFHCEELPA